ncbi:MAG TPA: phosphomannomutase/phosphoglucomutase [Thermoplasmata archaeon]|jgi:phosphomannomutase|nr:phosphomannomutase/phosphoglucomutase [Thermoplasmata archaeon]HIH29046.1 phosphomannomutase/phosphoglucomutase [Thermoplasmata archaeon]
MNQPISKLIFRAYDIRGLYNKDISPEVLYKIGLAAGTYVKHTMQGKQICVGGDIRQSSQSLVHAFIAGVTATGVHIVHTGTSSFGQTLFTGGQLKADLIAFVTASHLPPEWNGIKFYYGDGVGFPEENLMMIRDLVLQDSFELASWDHIGQVTSVDAKDGYHDFFVSRFNFKKKLKVALDCGGASMTLSAPEIFTSIGLQVAPVFCDPDPSFSKRPSDPKPKNLTTLVQTVKNNHCDFGVAFDGDGDRSVIVDNTGQILSADQTGIIIGKHGLKKNKGTIIVNVECSKSVKEQLEPVGYHIKQIQVGHTFLTLEAKQTKALLGIESSGHLIIPEYFLFDDALVVPLKIAQILENVKRPLHDLVMESPSYPTRKEEIECADGIKFDVIRRLKQELSKEYDQVNTMDGIRVDFKEGWVLIRASNTSPIIRLTAEADTTEILQELSTRFMKKTQEMIQQKKTTP